jgi:hypothetical protein
MDDDGIEPTSELQASAREWHRLQLAALAFVGLCGVLQGDSGGRNPMWLQTLAGVLVLAGLVLAGVAVVLVALVAWPLGAATDPSSAQRRLRVGIALTFLAVTLTALSAMSNWWPENETAEVTVTTPGGTACGTVTAGDPGWVTLATPDGRVRARITELVSVTPANGCG